MKRVVITGAGVITPVGIGKETFWNNIKSGKSGVGPIESFDVSEYNTRIAAEVKDFDPSEYIDKKEARRMDRFVKFAVCAAKMALADAGIDIEKEDATRVGTFIGSGIGGISTFEEQYKVLLEKGPGRISPFFIPMMISNMAVGQVAIATGAKGPNLTTVSACASGSDAVGQAFYSVSRGDADVIITGGTEATISPTALAGFCSMKALSTKNDTPEKAKIGRAHV